jgi:Flp pilus assembly protein TadD
MDALKLDETDPTPLANISTVKYETGDYAGCLTSIADALAKEKKTAKLLQLSLRRLRCYFHLGRLGYAIKAADELLGAGNAAQLKNEIEAIKTASQKCLNLAKTGSDRWPPDLPLYRPHM